MVDTTPNTKGGISFQRLPSGKLIRTPTPKVEQATPEKVEAVLKRSSGRKGDVIKPKTIAVAVGKDETGKTVVKNLEPYAGKKGVKQISRLTDVYGRLTATDFQTTTSEQGTTRSVNVYGRERNVVPDERATTTSLTSDQARRNLGLKDTSNIDFSYDPIFAPVRTPSPQETINVGPTLTPEDVGFFSDRPVLTLEATKISKFSRSKDAGNKALAQQGKLSFSELTLLPVAAGKATYDFGKGFVSAFSPAGISDAVGGVVTSSAKIITGESSLGKEFKSASDSFDTSLRTNTFETLGTVTAIVAGPKILKGAKTKALEAYSKVEPYKKYNVKEVGTGFEPHKGEFTQYLAEYQGESFTRGGRTVGVRRVQKPTLELFKNNPLEFGVSVVEKVKGRKPGQISRFDTVAENILLRDTPSEFATPVDELRLGGKKTTATSVTQDIGFAKDEFKVLGSGGKELTFTGPGANRMIVGGTEAAQFFAPNLIRTSAGVPKGTATANLFYAGLRGGVSDISKPIKFGSADPGFVIKTTTPKVVNKKLLSKDYLDLSQELAGFTEPATTQLSASTLKGVRTESEILSPVGTTTKTSSQGRLVIPGRGSLKVVYGLDVPVTTKKGLLSVYEGNIDYLKTRISQATELGKQSSEFNIISQGVIARDTLNIKRIEIAKAKLTGEPTSALSSEFSMLAKQNKDLVSSQGVSDFSRSEFSKKIGDTRSEVPYEYVGYEEIPFASSPLTASKITSGGLSDLRTTSFQTNTMSSTGPSSSSLSRDFKPSIASVPSIKGSSKPLVSGMSSFTTSNIPSLPSTGRSSRSSRGRSSKSSSPFVSSMASISSSPSSLSKGLSSKPSRSSKPSSTSYGGSSPYSYKPSAVPSPFTLTSRGPRNSFKPRKESSDFFVEIREKGLFKRVSGSFSNIKTAFKGGRQIVGQKAAASFRIRETGTGRIVTDLELQGDNTLRKSKKEAGVFIERLGKRIKSGGELKEITFKGIRSQRKLL